MTLEPRFALSALAALALAGCGESGSSENKGPVANNKVLESSVSDDMIAYNTLTSEPPAAKVEPKDGEKGSGSSGGTAPAGSASDDASAASDAPAPAEAPPAGDE